MNATSLNYLLKVLCEDLKSMEETCARRATEPMERKLIGVRNARFLRGLSFICNGLLENHRTFNKISNFETHVNVFLLKKQYRL